MRKNSGLFCAVYLTVDFALALLSWGVLSYFLFLVGFSLFWAGLWQLDLMVAPTVWLSHTLGEYFLLPFDIRIKTKTAYCLFFSWIIIGVILMLVRKNWLELRKT